MFRENPIKSPCSSLMKNNAVIRRLPLDIERRVDIPEMYVYQIVNSPGS